MTTRFLGGLNGPPSNFGIKTRREGLIESPPAQRSPLYPYTSTHRPPLAPELRVTPAFRSHSVMLRDFSFREAWCRVTWCRDLWSREPCPRSTTTFAAQQCGSCAHRKRG